MTRGTLENPLQTPRRTHRRVTPKTPAIPRTSEIPEISNMAGTGDGNGTTFDMKAMIDNLREIIREEVKNALRREDEESVHNERDEREREEEKERKNAEDERERKRVEDERERKRIEDEKEKVEVEKIKSAALSALTKKIDQLQNMMKGSTSMTKFDLESMGVQGMKKLPPKFSMPDVQKFDGTGNPELHLKQYGSIMAATPLDTEQKVGVFPLSLTGVAQTWYHRLPSSVQADWEELCQAFINQYSYNAEIEVSLLELTNIMQQPNESFSDFFIKWKNKAALLRQKPSEQDQVGLMMKNVLPNMATTLKGMNPTDFKTLYQAGQLSEDIERDKQKNSKGKMPYTRPFTQNPTQKTVDINQV